MGAFRGLYIIWYREVLRLRRDKARFFGAFAMPMLWLLIFGSGLRGPMGSLAPGVDFTRFLYPGIIAMTVLMPAFMAGLSVVWDREFGFLKEVLVAPVSRSAVAAGKVLGGATVAMFQGLVVMALSPLLGITLSPLLVLQILPLMLLLAMAMSGLGTFIASRMKSMEGFQVVMQLIVMPTIFLSGIFFPVSQLPAWLNALVKVNPVTYGVDSIRQLMLGGVIPAELTDGVAAAPLGLTLFGHTMSVLNDAMIIAAFSVITVGLAVWAFNVQE
jgi:ABC-2 type transport system permease protein